MGLSDGFEVGRRFEVLPSAREITAEAPVDELPLFARQQRLQRAARGLADLLGDVAARK